MYPYVYEVITEDEDYQRIPGPFLTPPEDYLFYVPVALALLLPAVGGAALTARGIFIGAEQVRPKP